MQGQQVMRQRKLAEALQAQADEPLQGQMVSGIYVAPSWTQGAAKLAKALSGKYQMAQADEREKALGRQMAKDRADAIKNYFDVTTGKPAYTTQADTDEHGIPIPRRTLPAVPGDAMAGAQSLISSNFPELQQFGMQQMQAEQERKRLAAALGIGQPSQGAPAGQNPAAGASPGFDRNGVPMDVAQSLLAVDPSGKQYSEYLRDYRKVHVTPEGTAVQMGQNGTLSPVPGSLSAVGQTIKAKKDAESPYEIVEVPMSDGTTMKMPKDQALKILSQSAQPPAQQATPIPPQNMANVQSSFVDPTAMQRHLAQMPEGPDKELVKAAIARDGVKPVVAGRTQSPADAEGAKKTAVLNAEQAQDAPRATKAMQSAIGQLDNVLRQVEYVNKSPGLDRITGTFNGSSYVPNISDKAVNAQSDLDTLKAMLSAESLQQMRDASKTGGAVGAVTEKEWPRLESLIGGLGQRQTTEQFQQRLSDIREGLQRIRDSVAQEHMTKYPGAQIPRYQSPNIRGSAGAQSVSGMIGGGPVVNQPAANGGWGIQRLP